MIEACAWQATHDAAQMRQHLCAAPMAGHDTIHPDTGESMGVRYANPADTPSPAMVVANVLGASWPRGANDAIYRMETTDRDDYANDLENKRSGLAGGCEQRTTLLEEALHSLLPRRRIFQGRRARSTRSPRYARRSRTYYYSDRVATRSSRTRQYRRMTSCQTAKSSRRYSMRSLYHSRGPHNTLYVTASLYGTTRSPSHTYRDRIIRQPTPRGSSPHCAALANRRRRPLTAVARPPGPR